MYATPSKPNCFVSCGQKTLSTEGVGVGGRLWLSRAQSILSLSIWDVKFLPVRRRTLSSSSSDPESKCRPAGDTCCVCLHKVIHGGLYLSVTGGKWRSVKKKCRPQSCGGATIRPLLAPLKGTEEELMMCSVMLRPCSDLALTSWPDHEWAALGTGLRAPKMDLGCIWGLLTFHKVCDVPPAAETHITEWYFKGSLGTSADDAVAACIGSRSLYL